MRSVRCDLCPKACVVAPGQSGECRIRVNVDGRLTAVTYGRPCSMHVDPIEKKPLYHFLPGTGILSMATVGCNLHCQNCQNWEISQENPENYPAHEVSPAALVQLARDYHCESIAYTYSEPLVFYEYTLDSCIVAREAGFCNVLVTAGYINRRPMEALCQHVDGANIDLKAMSDAFYREVCQATLKPVLATLELTKSAGVHVEVTNLVIPTLNDSDAALTDLARWIKANLGPETPLHFSRFHPQYKMRHLPATPPDTLDRAKAIAAAEGLDFVYIGNLARPDGGSTFCPECGAQLIRREGYVIVSNVLDKGACPECGTAIYGRWSKAAAR